MRERKREREYVCVYVCVWEGGGVQVRAQKLRKISRHTLIC